MRTLMSSQGQMHKAQSCTSSAQIRHVPGPRLSLGTLRDMSRVLEGSGVGEMQMQLHAKQPRCLMMAVAAQLKE